MLAENNEMEQFIKNHLYDVQNTGPHKQPWKFPGPWKLFGNYILKINEPLFWKIITVPWQIIIVVYNFQDPDENGFNILDAWNEDFENFEKVGSLFDTTPKSGCEEDYKNQNENSTNWNIISSNGPSEDVHMKCCLALGKKIEHFL